MTGISAESGTPSASRSGGGADPRDLRPKERGGDRRSDPRRVVDQRLHVAEQTVLSVSGRYVDRMLEHDSSDDDCVGALADLVAAVEMYRGAADAQIAALDAEIAAARRG